MSAPPNSQEAGTVHWVVQLAIVILGTGALALTFVFDYSSAWFYLFSALMGALWCAGWWFSRAAVIRPRAMGTLPALALGLAAGLTLAACCTVGVIILRDVPFFIDYVEALLNPVSAELLPPVLLTALLVGACEELMFRGAVHTWFRRHRILLPTLVYVLATLATLSPPLVAAAALLGFVTSFLRERTHTLVAPIACHLSWTLTLLLGLPLLVS